MDKSKKSKLEPWQIEDAARLLAIYVAYRDHGGLNQEEFAHKFGLKSQANLGHYLHGRSPLNIPQAKNFAEGMGVSIAAFSPRLAKEAIEAGALASGNNGALLATAPQEHQSHRKSTAEKDLVIPQYAAGGAMGNGLILEEKQPGIIKSWHVDREWIRHNVPHYTSAENLCIVTGFGPSMRPKYNPGDPLLLDRGVNIVETEGIYFFRVSNHGFIKQLQRIPTEDGMIIRAKSLNKDYDPFDITAKMDFEVFGKVLTVWRSEQV